MVVYIYLVTPEARAILQSREEISINRTGKQQGGAGLRCVCVSVCACVCLLRCSHLSEDTYEGRLT